MSNVVVTERWHKRSLTTLMGTRASSRREAWVCRSVCSDPFGRPAFLRRAENRLLAHSGWTGPGPSYLHKGGRGAPGHGLDGRREGRLDDDPVQSARPTRRPPPEPQRGRLVVFRQTRLSPSRWRSPFGFADFVREPCPGKGPSPRGSSSLGVPASPRPSSPSQGRDFHLYARRLS